MLRFGLWGAYESDNAEQKAQAVLKEQATEILDYESAAEKIP